MPSKKKKICVCHSISVVGSSHIYHCSTLVYENVMSRTEHLFSTFFMCVQYSCWLAETFTLSGDDT